MISCWNNLSDTVGSSPGTDKSFILINCLILRFLKVRSYDCPGLGVQLFGTQPFGIPPHSGFYQMGISIHLFVNGVEIINPGQH